MSDQEQKPAEPQVSEEQRDAELLSSIESAEQQEPAATRSFGLGKALAVLVLAFALVVAGLAANGQLQPLYQMLLDRLQTAQPVVKQVETVAPVAQSAAVPEPTAEPVPAAMEAAPAEPAAVSAAEPAAEPAVSPESAIISEQAAQLAEANASIAALREELAAADSSKAELQQQLAAEQRLNLQGALKRIADPGLRLAQLAAAWRALADNEQLTDAERARASELADQAAAAETRLQGWRSAVVRWIDTLGAPAGEDVIPTPAHPSLAWVTKQFHLRKAPSRAVGKMADLRDRLQLLAIGLADEQWPADEAWQEAYQDLVKLAGQNSDPGLPDSFAGMRATTDRLHHAAELWLDEVK